MENKNLTTNEYYSLHELFSQSDRKIIIPDFQRDYCWGDKTHGENNTDIVGGFLDTLIEELVSNSKEVLLGKIDVYESPKNHIYLTDGQQRLTTLYLIIGMLYRKEQGEELKKKLKCCLISDFEEIHDDKEPYLQYAVRESTVFFLRDLVNEFFIKENSLMVSDIQSQHWYFSEYDFDPSIISMLSAMEIIEEKLNSNKVIEITKFSAFVINNIKIQYYDVKDKKHGEERFVIINTTENSLTPSENIKPILLGNIKDTKLPIEWEERETWFWKNRDKQKENIADHGVNVFLTWCFQIIDKQDDIDIIKKAKTLLKAEERQPYLEKIQSHFEALKLIIEYLKEDKFQTQFKFINDNYEVKSIVDIRNMSQEKQQNVILPLLSFISRSYNNDECYQFLRRLRKNYFDQKWQQRRINYVDWRYIIQIIEISQSVEEIFYYETTNQQHISEIRIIPNITIKEWYNDEEVWKDFLRKKNDIAIKMISDCEDHPHFMGDLTPLLSVTERSPDLSTIEKYFHVYNHINFKDFTLKRENIVLSNLFRLSCLLDYNNWDHRTIGDKGYCMILEHNVNRYFLLTGFNEIWKNFVLGDVDMMNYFKNKIRVHFDFLKEESVFSSQNEIKIINHYNTVRLWALLECLFSDNKEVDYSNSIACYWDKNFNLKNQEGDNIFQLGNLLLGTSYYNNKTGSFSYNLPLMQKTKNVDFDMTARSVEYHEKLKDFLKAN